MLFFKAHHGFGSSILRAFIACLLYLSIIPSSLQRWILERVHCFVFIAAVTAFIYSGFHVYWLNVGRGWSINPIPYTTVSAAVTSICLIFFLCHDKQNIRRLMLLGFTLALNSLVISQTRGTALALTSATIVMLAYLTFLGQLKMKRLGLVALSAIAVISVNSTSIEQRIVRTEYEMARISDDNFGSSIGLRLQMWRAGFELIPDKFWLGHGDKHISAKQHLADTGFIDQAAVPFTHYHNQFIDALVKDGIFSFVLICALLLLPLIGWWQTQAYSTPSSWSHRQVSQLAMVAMVLVFAAAALTDVPFSHAQSISIYLCFIFIAQLYPQNLRQKATDNANTHPSKANEVNT
ncbi:O-antigen ligase family protein [Vibrio sp. SM6]|uniref:O-antigen ligase family protein n=1 Tax=Vibrio agarilyticus TaxID=2726741 RepID=A0A7X8TRN1_9VIBR|nr:O-antigen ligase family protein [Vibrio agarilyticus]NLS13566.1 O-antigen ligase family protein [Vibrio agarilyticus]